MNHIFISYAREDEAAVKKLYNTIKQAGFNPWLDQINILPGKEWETEIRKGIKNAAIFLACLSNNSINKRGIVQKEFKFALEVLKEFPENKVYFIPLRLDKCEVPEKMAKLQWIDIFLPDGYEKLIDALTIHLTPKALNIKVDKFLISERVSDDYKERGRNEVREWGKKMVSGHWDWYNLGNALEDYLDAIKNNPYNQHAWTNIAYVYHLIGNTEIAEMCLSKSYKLAKPGPNHPGRNYKNVELAIKNKSYLSGGNINIPVTPYWFKEKYKSLLELTESNKINFHNIQYYLSYF